MLDVISDNELLNNLWELKGDIASSKCVIYTNMEAARKDLGIAPENLKIYETNIREFVFTFFAGDMMSAVKSPPGKTLKRIISNLENLKDVSITLNKQWQVVRLMRLEEVKLAKIVLRDDLDYCYILKDDYVGMFKEVPKVTHKTLFGHEVVKVNKSVVQNIDIEKFEHDIGKDYRYSVDMHKTLKPIKNYRRAYIDIETDGSVDVVNTPKSVTSTVVYDTYDKKYYAYLFHPQAEEKEFVRNGWEHAYYTNEREMIRDIFVRLKKTDVILGWNILTFDLLYLVKRYEKLGGDINEISPVGKVKWKIMKDEDRFELRNFRIYGLDCFDAMLQMRDIVKYYLDKPKNMSLNTISQFVLGEEEGKMEISSPSELWKTKNFDTLIDYNQQDVELVQRIVDKVKLFDYYSSIRDIVPSVSMDETKFNSIIIDKLILTQYSHLVFPSKKWAERINIEGAFISEPTPGIHPEVAVFDFNALYPNLIKSLNISPETIDAEGEIVIDDVRFTGKKEGLLPSLVDFLMNERYRYKKLMQKHPLGSYKHTLYDMMQTGFKARVNSVYGVFALPSFRLYNSDVARSITAAGRKTLKRNIKYVEEMEKNFAPIYGDTDSVFVKNLKPSSDVFADFQALEKRMNTYQEAFLKESFVNFVSHNIIIEVETYFTKLILSSAKKKYIGLTKIYKGDVFDEPKLTYRGFVLIRKDCPLAVKSVLENLVMILLKGTEEDMVEAVKEARTLLKEVPWHNLTIYKQISREIHEYKVVPQHVRAMMYSNENLGTNFSKANYVGGMMFVKRVPQGKPKTDVIAVDESTKSIEGFEIDHERYFTLFIKNPITLILSGEGARFFERDTLRKWLYDVGGKNVTSEVPLKQK